MPMFSAPPRTGVPMPTPGLDEEAAAVVDELELDEEQPARALPAAPASTTAPPATAPLAMKVRRLISLFSLTQTPPVRPDGHQAVTSCPFSGPAAPLPVDGGLLALTLPQAESAVGAQ